MKPHRKRKLKKQQPLLQQVILTALAILPVVTRGEVAQWMLNAVAPVTNLVSINEDLDFRLMSQQKTVKGDCIRYVFNNPYFDDAPETYKSFDMTTPYSEPCNFSTSHEGLCSTIDQKTFEMKFTEDNPNKKITATTNGKPFTNPYSSRSFSRVETTYYEGCDLAKPVVESRTSISAFQQQVIMQSNIDLTSSSEKLAVPNAVLSVAFKVKSMMPHEGSVSLKVPSWYTISDSRVPVQSSSESMLSFDSTASFESHASKGFSVVRTNFDASSRSLLIVYRGAAIIKAGESVVFKVTDFKNPVNQAEKTGFSITIMDQQGYLVDQSESNLRLDTPMNEVGRLVGKEVMMLGDSDGLNLGRVFEYNKISFFMSSYIPFEQYCYFKFVFPDKLMVDSELAIIEGDGIFKPFDSGNVLPGNFWRVDLEANTIYVEGCKLPQFLNSRPFGVISFSYVLLPDYVTDLNPVELYAYSDFTYQSIVFKETKADGGGMSISRQMLQPGHLELQDFRPTNYFAFVEQVTYTVQIQPQHDMYPSTRVVLTMPEHIAFDGGCTVTYTEGDCQLGPEANELTLTNVFKERTAGGTNLKFIISFGNNPIGARYAGDWGARTEGVYDGKYYIMDGASNGFSFKALPGYIKSTLTYRGTTTFSDESFYDFTFNTEHSVPADGYLRVTLPREMAFPPKSVETQRVAFTLEQNIQSVDLSADKVKFSNVTQQYILFEFPKGHNHNTANPLRLTLENVRTPRSFRPSSDFVIETTSPEGYIIDQGGSDITVTMNTMNSLKGLDIQVNDLSNGAVTAYQFKIDTFVHLMDQDRIVITTPTQVGFGPDGISCRSVSPDPIGVTAITCENIDSQTLAVQLSRVDKQDGIFEFIVDGLKNPPNFRRSGQFSNIYMETFDYYDMQKLFNYADLFIQTDTPGTIRDYQLQQSTEIYSLDAIYTITFSPFNPISKDGIITLEWTDQVVFYEADAVCKVETYQAFTGGDNCVIDFEKRYIEIKGVFKDDLHFSQVVITLNQLRNPSSNINLKKFKLRTYDDPIKEFPIDMLDYNPLTVCHWPCERCNADKDFCIKCWDRPDVSEKFMTTTETYSTCANECHPGYTTNGDPKLVCQKCDSPCGTCADAGDNMDKYKCLTCAAGYPLRMGDTCVPTCPTGTFQKGEECLPCSSKCQSCVDNADHCTSCAQNTDLKFLLNNKCLTSCPERMGNLAGVCFDCIFPCLGCSTGPDICNSCSQENGISFLLGPTCTNQCPVGYIVNKIEKQCEGCGPGCIDCDPQDQRICLQCAEGLMMMEDECVQDCPSGYLSNYDTNTCKSISDLDIALIPFPCLIIAMVMFFLSYVGSMQKQKHILVSNWLVLMCFLEHGCLLSQIILTAKYGTPFYLVFIVLAWLVFVGTNIAWVFMFMKQVVRRDRQFRNWRNNKTRVWAKWVITIGGLLGSWKTHKLTYSAFWGFFNLTPAKFSEPRAFRALQKKFLQINMIGCYSIVLIINLIGLFDMNWGTQLYIQILENIIIFAMLIWASLWEQGKCETDYLSDKKYKTQGRIGVMSAFQDDDDGQFSKTADQLLFKGEIGKLFVERKFQDLIVEFSGRMCKSDYEPRDKEEDPRLNKTWPVSPDFIPSDGPVEPLPDPHPDNCYSRGYNEEQMLQMKYLSKGMTTKAQQSDNYDADYNLRKDATLVGHQRDLGEAAIDLTQPGEKRKTRGRKNRYFKQIDNEDHEAGFLLDDDEEGKQENLKAKNELLDAATSLEAKRVDEEKKIEMQETKLRAVQLTEENLRLKKILEEQRQVDVNDQIDIQKRIVEEEKRRQAILADIETARKERETHKNTLMKNLNDEKEARLKEIEKMKADQLKKMQSLTEQDRIAAEAEFNNEKARLESEFNEKMLKSQREAAPPSAAANSPARHASHTEIAPTQEVIRVKPTAAAPAHVHTENILSEHRVSTKGDASVKGKLSSKAGTPMRSSKAGSVRNETPLKQTPVQKSVEVSVMDGTPAISVKSGKDSQPPSPVASVNEKHNISAMLTADDDVGGLGDSFVMNVEFEKRDFNEIDILGTLERDDKGNIIVPVDEKTGSKKSYDKEGRPINQYGYLVDSNTGNVVQTDTGAVVFTATELDERGNIPMPFALEKFNFNPFDLLGTFFYDDVEDPLSFQKTQRAGRYIDELGRGVSLQGFLVNEQGSVINKNSIKRFDWKQFRQFGGLMPKLFNYYGKTFELQEVMGVFDRDSRGNIQLLLGKDERGKDVYVDKAGFMVNQRGYIVTRDGHICTREGKVLFLKAQLKNGEFPKIFPFTRFNINRVIGDVEMDPGGQPILQKNDVGLNIDKKGRIVNERGFLCDKYGNVVDVRGKLVFEKALLEHNGDIPEIFRSNILRSDSQSSLSRFMSEIDRDQRFDDSALGKHAINPARHAGASDTSFESMMDDSPSKYDRQNMRFSHSNPDSLPYGSAMQPKSARWAGTIPDNIMEEMSEYEAGAEPRRKRKRGKGKGYVVEAVTGRDVQMANAYGGVAKPRVRKTGPRFGSVARIDRTGLQTSQGSMRPANPRIQNFAAPKPFIEAAEPNMTYGTQLKKDSSTNRGDITTQRTGVTFEAGKAQREPNTTSNWNEQHGEQPSIQVESADDEEAGLVNNLRTKLNNAKKKRKGSKPKVETSKIINAETTPNQMQSPKYDRQFEDEYEKVYKKDIDQFIEGSDFEVESLAGFSEISKGTFKSVMQNPRMKGLEKVYLQRLEFQQLGQKAKKYRPKPAVKREFLDRFCDDPKYIAKGEKLKFEVGGQTQTGSSGKKKPPQASPYQEPQQRSQSSLLGQDVGMAQTHGQMRPTQTPENFKIALQESGSPGQRGLQQQQQPSRPNLR